MFKIMIYKEPRQFVLPENHQKRDKVEIDDAIYVPSASSIRRTKTLIKDIVLCNDFDLFCTLTLDPTKVDRYNYFACMGKISRWLHHQKTKSPDFKYLIIPEQHKDGAWHFHGLLKNYSGTLKKTSHKSSSGRSVYNITSYRSGFSTAVKIDDSAPVAAYVTKYITKDFMRSFNRRRFFCSRNLKRPVKTINSSVFRDSLPLERHHVADFESVDYWLVEKF